MLGVLIVTSQGILERNAGNYMVGLLVVKGDKRENHHKGVIRFILLFEERKSESSNKLEFTSLSQEEAEKVRVFFNSLETPMSTCNFAYSGELPLSFGFNFSQTPSTCLTGY